MRNLMLGPVGPDADAADAAPLAIVFDGSFFDFCADPDVKNKSRPVRERATTMAT